MRHDHDSILQNWQAHAAKHEDANFRFLHSLKVVSRPERIDALAAELHAEAFRLIDCTRCANCCKTLSPGVSDEDVHRIAAYLRLSREQVIETYLEVEPEQGGYRMKATPCPFLGSDDRCTIYDVRPKDCRHYPNTDRKGFTQRVYQHTSNTVACPAVYYIVEKLRQRRRR